MATEFVMLVEGPDDYHVLQHLLTVHGVNQQISYRMERYREPPKLSNKSEIVFREREGVDNVLIYLAEQLGFVSDLKRIGVVVDADTDVAARWQSLRDILIASGYKDVPRKPFANGVIVEHEEKPCVGIWIMPNNTLPGMTEDFVRLLVPPEDVLWERAVLCVEQIPIADRLFSDSALIKAHVHTWLAWQKVPGLPMGQAISNRWLNAEVPEARRLVDWLKRLFDLTDALEGQP